MSGYKTVTALEVSNLLGGLAEKRLTINSIRVYFAVLSLEASREAFKRSRAKEERAGDRIVRFLETELIKATGGLKAQAISRELRRLKKLGLLIFSEKEIKRPKVLLPEGAAILDEIRGKRSEKRPIPMPRRILTFLARSKKKSEVLTVISYLVRGLTLSRTGEITSSGSVKASWIAAVTGLSLRAVKAARAALIRENWISKDESSHQRKLNRTGSYFTVNLEWKRESRGEEKGSEFAPPLQKKEALFAPPYKDKKTPYGSNNQKTSSSGVSTKREEVGGPDITNIRQEDLESFSRTEKLYRQAVERKWVKDSESTFLNWVAAACKAKRIQAGDRVRIFVGIVKQGLWSYLTQEDEERAALAIRTYQHKASGDVIKGTLQNLVKDLLKTVGKVPDLKSGLRKTSS